MPDRDWPPSTEITAPLTRLACMEQMKATTLATSSTSPKRPSGISLLTNSAMPSGSAFWRRSQPPPVHRIEPGATAFTVTPLAATSRASDLTTLISAALAPPHRRDRDDAAPAARDHARQHQLLHSHSDGDVAAERGLELVGTGVLP